MIEAVIVEKIPRNRFMNFDQTSCPLVSSGGKTIDFMGAKEVIVVDPPGDKECFTISLAVKADGEKLPAIIVFKGNCKNGELSERTLKGLVIPANIRVKSSGKAWWNEKLNLDWISETFSSDDNKMILLRDNFSVHKMSSTQQALRDRNVEQVLVPTGRTGKYQPLDVGVMRPFKAAMNNEYHQWRVANDVLSDSGELKKPTRQDFINFASKAWDSVTPDCVRNSFRHSLQDIGVLNDEN